MRYRWVVSLLVAAVLVMMPAWATPTLPAHSGAAVAPAPALSTMPSPAQERNVARDLRQAHEMVGALPTQEAGRSLECYMLLAAGWLYALGGQGSNAMAWAVTVCNAQASQQ
jgi:hypothetical protein